MSPILESIGSVKGFGWGALAASGSFESISTVTVSTAVSSISFTSIPATYTHLQIRMHVRNTSTSNGYNMRMNSDTGNNYARHYLYSTGAAIGAANNVSTSSMILADAGISTSTAGVFGSSFCDILDYRNTSKNKTIKTFGGFDNNGNGLVSLTSGLWFATPAAVTTLTIFPDAGNFAQYSSFALYGIKGE